MMQRTKLPSSRAACMDVTGLGLDLVGLPTRGLQQPAAPGAPRAQVGAFTTGQRAATVALRGAQFAAVGFLASLFGHGLTVYLVRGRRCLRASAERLADRVLWLRTPAA